MSLSFQEEGQLITKIMIERAVARLNLQQQIAISLKVAGFHYHEAAAIMGVSITRYAGILKKGRRALKAELKSSGVAEVQNELP